MALAGSVRKVAQEETDDKGDPVPEEQRLIVFPGMELIRYAQRHGTRRPWLLKLLQRRTTKIAAVAMVNKIARIVWVLMARGGAYHEPVPQAA
jgi:transposase